MKKVPPRLHVLIARKADYAVVIRRGPSKHTSTIGWDMKTNIFTLGQWFKGRIYERRSDLSPDGNHMIYFAMNGKWHTEVKGSWTAISKTPYLKAIGLWPKGDCWNGGGLFVSDSKYWINHGYGHSTIKIPPELTEVHEVNLEYSVGNECLGVYFPRLLRDGWKLLEQRKDDTYFEKRLKSHWRIRKIAHATLDPPIGKGVYHDEHELYNTVTKETLKFPSWEWADIKKHHLYWTESGKIFSSTVNENGLCDINILSDFNDMTFESIEAPY